MGSGVKLVGLLSRRALPVVVATLFVVVPRFARAEGPDLDFELGLGGGVTLLRETPVLRTDELGLSARSLRPSDVATRGGMTMAGGYGDIVLVADDRWAVPLLGLGLYTAVGPYDEVATSLDGSIASMRPWTQWRADVLLPGFGLRMKHRRLLLAAKLRTGVDLVFAQGSVASGAERVDFTATGASFLLVGEIEGCRRLDPVTRVCLTLAPRLYDFGVLTGATLGIRLAVGR